MPPYVLLVESDAELQRQVADVLREANYEISTEREGAWARRSLLVRAPEALIVDTHLADGSGFEVADELRKDPDTAKVPIFFLASSHWGAHHASEARRRFAPASYLPVPFDPSSLLARLLEAVPPGSRPATPPPPRPLPAIIDAAQEKEKREVERQASKWSASETTRKVELPELMAKVRRPRGISGSLARQSFAQVLRRIYLERRSGALLSVRGKTKKIVYFKDGYPVAARSNVLSECLGQYLVTHKRISAADLETSVRLMQTQKRQQGEVLVEMGVLSPHGLRSALVEQMEAKLFEMFAWTQGEFSFKDGVAAPGSPVHVERPTAALILEGVRRTYPPARIEDVLNVCAGKFVVPTSNPMLRMQDMTQDASERRFIEGLDGTQMLEQILNVPPIPRERARLVLAAMLEAGMIEASNEPLSVPIAGASGGDTQPGRQSRSELEAVLASMRGQTHFRLLGVDGDADAQQIESAYVRLARGYHPDAYRARSPEVRDLVDQIFRRIGEARAVLRDPTKRRSYLKRLERARSHPGADDRAVAAAEAVYYTGVEHMRRRRFAEALEALRNATRLVPGQASYHNALGWAYYRRSPTEPASVARAKQELERAIELDAEDPWLQVSLGRFLAEIGNPAGAATAFEAALRIKPDLHDIGQEIRRLRGSA